jgi:hypothetical protein
MNRRVRSKQPPTSPVRTGSRGLGGPTGEEPTELVGFVDDEEVVIASDANGWDSFNGMAVTAAVPPDQTVDVLWDDPFAKRVVDAKEFENYEPTCGPTRCSSNRCFVAAATPEEPWRFRNVPVDGERTVEQTAALRGHYGRRRMLTTVEPPLSLRAVA